MTMKCKFWTLTKRFTLLTKHKHNQIFGCAKDILSECPKFTFVQQTFSLQLSVAIGRLSFYLTCCHRLEKLVLDIWFLIIHLRKVR